MSGLGTQEQFMEMSLGDIRYYAEKMDERITIIKEKLAKSRGSGAKNL